MRPIWVLDKGWYHGVYVLLLLFNEEDGVDEKEDNEYMDKYIKMISIWRTWDSTMKESITGGCFFQGQTREGWMTKIDSKL